VEGSRKIGEIMVKEKLLTEKERKML